MSEETPRRRAPLLSFRYLFYDFVKATAVLPALIWLRPKWIYENKAARRRIRGGALLVANHTAMIDPVCLMTAVWYRRQHFVCIRDFFEKRYGILFKGFHCIPIDRENFCMDSMRAITDILKEGRVVSIFPEGRITGERENHAFKAGAVLMSVQAKCPVVPVFMAPPKGLKHRLRVVIGEPVDVCGMYGPRPGMRQIQEANRLLFQKEEELSRLITHKGGNIE